MEGARQAPAGGVLMPQAVGGGGLLMAGSFGILFVILVVGAANLALGYAAAVYFGKARLEIVWLTFTLPNPLAWLRREERAEASAPATVTFAHSAPPAETAYDPPPGPAVPAPAYAPHSQPEPMSAWQPAAQATADDASLEASLSAYSAAAQEMLPHEPAGDFGPADFPAAASDSASYEPSLVAPTAEAGLDALLDDLVAQNVSELQGAFARIDQPQPSARPATEPIREAVTVP